MEGTKKKEEGKKRRWKMYTRRNKIDTKWSRKRRKTK